MKVVSCIMYLCSINEYDSLIIDLWTSKHEISSFTTEYIKKTKRRWDQMVDKPTVNDIWKCGIVFGLCNY